ncbi:MAG: PD40 domain-containing protein, partial [Acidobacteriaceae bacterium]|nr:PD40 domain-containing protein [Acidobacteriaceae bacterium]
MQETAKSARVFRFGVFEVNAATGELRKQGLRIRLQEQPSQLLLMLLDRAGDVVSREEIRRKLWSPDTFVDFDQGLGAVLRKLRQALCDDADTPRYIETIPKHGFRFLPPVERISAVSPPAQSVLPVHLSEPPAPEVKRGPETKGAVPSLWWAVFGSACVLSFVLGWLVHTRSAAQDGNTGQQLPRLIRSSVLPPSNWFFEHSSFSISPDGTRLAFVAVGPDGNGRLWIRTLSSSNAQQVNGTDGALLPFWSPDSRRIGFFAAGKLNIVDLDSGAVRILCEAPFGRCGGAWGRDGTIVFSPFVTGPLYRIPDTGGVPVVVTHMAHPGPGRRHMWPSFLPDGRHFLYSESSGPADPLGESIYVGALDGSAAKLVCSSISGNVAYAAGYLLYGRDHTLWAQPFDLRRLELSGAATSVTSQELDQERSFSHAEFSASENGILVFQSLADSKTRLVWFDGNGKQLDQLAELGYRDPRLSPDGRFLAVSSDDARNGKVFIRVYDLARGISARLTDGGTDRSPAWSPDGKRITYTTLDALKEVPAEGSSPPQLLLKGSIYLGHIDWSPDGHAVFTDLSAGFPTLKIYGAAAHRVVPFAIGAEARFSPDGKWIAYVGPLTVPDSDAIFIAPFPGPGERVRVSSGSGAQPTWAHDGRHLFYITPDRKLMMVDFNARTKSATAPRVLFQTQIIGPNFSDSQYAVSPDGRFLINSFPPNASSPLS